jgi:hypothetical protein
MRTFHFRVPASVRQAFEVKAAGLGKPYAVLRELVDAFIDGRITIERHITLKENER